MSRTVSVRRLLAVLAAVALAMPASLTAQVKVQVVPFFTSYYSLGNVADKTLSNLDFNNPPDGIADKLHFKSKQTAGPGLGLRARAWMTPLFGFEGSFAYIWNARQLTITPDTVSGPRPNTITGATFENGHTLLVSGRVLFRPRRSNLHFLAGAGYMKVGGDAWDVKKFSPGTKLKTNNLFGVLGFGARANVTPKLALDVSVEANFYKVDRVNAPPFPAGVEIFDSKSHSDFLVSIGIPFGGR